MMIKDIAIIGVGNLAQSLLYRLESSKTKLSVPMISLTLTVLVLDVCPIYEAVKV